MLAAIIILLILIAIILAAVVWRLRTMRADRAPPEVIYLGYDDQDNVNSLRSTMLDRLARGDLE